MYLAWGSRIFVCSCWNLHFLQSAPIKHEQRVLFLKINYCLSWNQMIVMYLQNSASICRADTAVATNLVGRSGEFLSFTGSRWEAPDGPQPKNGQKSQVKDVLTQFLEDNPDESILGGSLYNAFCISKLKPFVILWYDSKWMHVF